ncbi:hypothetical protein Tco_0232932 [Tanacetum coccineum]
MPKNRPAFYNNDDDDEEYTIVITPVLPTVERDNSLSIGDKHLSTIPEKEESSVKDLVLILSEFEGISDSICDVPFCDNSTPLETSKDHFEILLDFNDDSTSSDDDSLYSKDINYVDASPPDYELVSLEEVKDFDPENGEIDDDILLIKDNILREKLLNIHLFIAKIEALKDNSTLSSDFKSSGNPTSHSDLSLPNYEALFCDSEPDSRDFTLDVVKDIFNYPTREPRVHVPNVLPTYPTLHLDSDIPLSSDSLGSDLVVSFPFRTRNKIFDLGIFIRVQSKRFLSPDEFSISFILDPPFPVIDTLLLFSSKNEDKFVNPGFLATGTEYSLKDGYVEIHAINLREMIFVMVYVPFDMVFSAYLIGSSSSDICNNGSSSGTKCDLLVADSKEHHVWHDHLSCNVGEYRPWIQCQDHETACAQSELALSVERNQNTKDYEKNIQSSEVTLLNDVMDVVKQTDLNKEVFEDDNELDSDTEDVLAEVEDP